MPLILVATPIGNLADFSPRAREALSTADLIAAEDTRVTSKLLAHYGIRRPLISYHAHNLRDREEQLLTRLVAGESVVLVSDAGMPAISDPGQELVAACHQQGIAVTVIPGASAGIAALAVSGLATGRFCFEGFLSMNKRARREHLAALVQEERTMIFYEAPHKLLATLRDFANTFGGDRKITLVRELTKLHEELRCCTLDEAVVHYSEHAPRGEFVLVISGGNPSEKGDLRRDLEEAVLLAEAFIADGTPPTEAAKQAAAATGRRKAEVYKALISN